MKTVLLFCVVFLILPQPGVHSSSVLETAEPAAVMSKENNFSSQEFNVFQGDEQTPSVKDKEEESAKTRLKNSVLEILSAVGLI